MTETTEDQEDSCTRARLESFTDAVLTAAESAELTRDETMYFCAAIAGKLASLEDVDRNGIVRALSDLMRDFADVEGEAPLCGVGKKL